jgi:hypothetical protein
MNFAHTNSYLAVGWARQNSKSYHQVYNCITAKVLHFCRIVATHHSCLLLPYLFTQIYSTNVKTYPDPLVYTPFPLLYQIPLYPTVAFPLPTSIIPFLASNASKFAFAPAEKSCVT